MKRPQAGFTLIELLVTLALLGVVSMAALPLVEMTYKRSKEAELRLALRTIRSALDEYRAAVDGGLVPRTAGASGYPPSLEALTEPLPLAAAAGSRDEPPRVVVLLRRLPRDPLSADPTLPAARTWRVRRHGARADEWEEEPGADVFDVASRSTDTALDGTRYDSW